MRMQLWRGLFVIFGTVIATACAATIMTYVCLAVPIGPWIDPTIALLALAVSGVISSIAAVQVMPECRMIVAGAGIGGIAATAVAFSVPTIAFIDSGYYQHLLSNPYLFIAHVGGLIVCAGLFGLGFVVWRREEFLARTDYVYPLAVMVEKTLSAYQMGMQSLKMLAAGIGSVGLLQFGMRFWGAGERMVRLFAARSWMIWSFPSLALNLDFLPMLISIGVMTGDVIAVPFAIGVVLKYLIVEPIHCAGLVCTESIAQCMLAFCSGLVIEGVVSSLWSQIRSHVRHASAASRSSNGIFSSSYAYCATWLTSLRTAPNFWFVVGCFGFGATWMWYAIQSSIGSLLFLVLATGACVYQLMIFMARAGLAPLGRYATFVMVPGMILFGYGAIEAALVAALVEIAGGVAASAISGCALLERSGDTRRVLLWCVYVVAICTAALTVATILWVLSTKIGLGSISLVAQKAHLRALQLQVHTLPIRAVLVGVVCGACLKLLGINSTLALGGILMGFDWSCILIFSGLLGRYLPRKELFAPFWSGMCAASSLWIIARALW